MLRRFRLMLVRTAKKRNEGYMDKEAVFSSDFKGNLSCGFKERLGFDIAYRAAYFGYDNVGVGLFSDSVNKIFNLVCYMGNYLNGRTELFAAAFFV